jgi:hypothetical protein
MNRLLIRREIFTRANHGADGRDLQQYLVDK